MWMPLFPLTLSFLVLTCIVPVYCSLVHCIYINYILWWYYKRKHYYWCMLDPHNLMSGIHPQDQQIKCHWVWDGGQFMARYYDPVFIVLHNISPRQSRTPEYWMHHMGRDRAMSAALQLQHDAGLILSNLQVLGHFVTSLNRISSEVMRVAFAHEPFPTESVQSVVPSHRIRRAAHYIAAMGLWRPLTVFPICRSENCRTF